MVLYLGCQRGGVAKRGKTFSVEKEKKKINNCIVKCQKVFIWEYKDEYEKAKKFILVKES